MQNGGETMSLNPPFPALQTTKKNLCQLITTLSIFPQLKSLTEAVTMTELPFRPVEPKGFYTSVVVKTDLNIINAK